MCGITGFWSSPTSTEELLTDLEPTARAILHRGPDDGGLWVDGCCGIAMGHRRLSILDLSPEGRQPMFSASGRYVIAFNGEVYNFEELRKQLPGVAWRGHSDTEVILAAVEAWGLKTAVERFVGMFAFALWDRQERRLQLVRDRIGIKPLYYGWSGATLFFASELRAMRQHPDFHCEIDRAAVAAYLRHNYIPSPHTIYEGIYKLEAGTIACFAGATTTRCRSREILVCHRDCTARATRTLRRHSVGGRGRAAPIASIRSRAENDLGCSAGRVSFGWS